MTMRLKKSLETSWNVDGKQLRELKNQWTTKFYRFFAKENFHLFLYRHGGAINMQSIAAEAQNVKMELSVIREVFRVSSLCSRNVNLTCFEAARNNSPMAWLYNS